MLPVIFFHAGFGWASGGYVGVDVFFVISGYLITGILLRGHEAGRFSMADFYRRRCLRILPALGFVLAVTSVFAWLWMTPGDLVSYSKSLLSVVTSTANFWFWSDSGYFDVRAELKPLLHTWSLAVEEQFYIIYPLVLALVWKFAKSWLLPLVAFGAVTGFLLSEWMVPRHPDVAYYWLPPRAWELLVGAVVALAQARFPKFSVSHLVAEGASLLGMAAVLVSVGLYTSTTQFPGINALLPVLGTAAILAVSRPGTAFYRLMSFRPVQLLGLASYSIYLWHQPLLALGRLRKLEALTLTDTLFLCLLAIGLGLLTWKFIEVPMRRWRGAPPWKIFAGSIAGGVALAAVGGVAIAGQGMLQRFPPELVHIMTVDLEGGAACTLFERYGEKVPPDCVFGDPEGARSVALYGDSHAETFLAPLDAAFKARGIRGIRVNITQCEPIPFVTVAGLGDDTYAQCMDAFRQTVASLARQASGIVVAIRWSYRLYPVPGEINQLTFDNGEGGVEFDSERTYVARGLDGAIGTEAPLKRQAVQQMFDALMQTGLPVAIVHPVPETGVDIKRYNFVTYLDRGALPEDLTTSYTRYQERNDFVERILDDIAGPGVSHVRPAAALCDTLVPDRCVVQHGDRFYYADDDHLSAYGAGAVLDANAEALRPLLYPPAP